MSALDEPDGPFEDAKPVPAPRMSLPIFDPSKYREHVKDLDLTQEQQDEMLRALWDIMAAFVDLGWGVDSVQRLFPEFNELSSQALQDGLEQIETDGEATEAFNTSVDEQKNGEE